MFTRIHTNRKWIFLNEILVLPHAAFIALNQGGGIVSYVLLGIPNNLCCHTDARL